jgi:circadian clock protein KaiB
MKRVALKLFVSGLTPRAEQAVQNIVRLCDRLCPDDYDLAVIDVLDDPQAAEREKILATPTLMRESPLPRRRIIGNHLDERTLQVALEL